MMARTRRNAQRPASRRTPASQTRAGRTRAAIAAAVVAGGGTIAVAAMAAGGHGAGPAAAPAAYATRSPAEGTVLATALADWNSARPGTYSQLAQLTSVRGYSQTSHRGRTLDIQRGIVVLATSRFLVLQSAGGTLHLWLLSPGTRFQNVSGTAAGTAALTASTSATRQAMQTGNMIPAATLLAGSPTTAAGLLTPTATARTVSVHVANTDLTVTVTVTRSTATVSQTATTPANAAPAPIASTYTLNAWQAANSVARGDLAVVVGTRSHGTLHAQLVLFSPLSTSAIGGTGTTLAHPSAVPTHW
jgi:hypothetical protein